MGFTYKSPINLLYLFTVQAFNLIDKNLENTNKMKSIPIIQGNLQSFDGINVLQHWNFPDNHKIIKTSLLN